MQIRIFFGLFFVLIGNLYGSSDCNITINISYTTPSNPKLTITHDPNCTITIEDQNQTIAPEDNQTIQTPTTLTQNIIALAKSKLGSPYKVSTAGPDTFDCSGFVYYLFERHKIHVPRTSIEQSEFGKKLTRKEIDVGDILTFDTSSAGHVNHTGIYLGNGEFIHASSGKSLSVTISKLDSGFYSERFQWGVRVKL